MDLINKQVANLLREEIKTMRSDTLVQLESERALERRLGIGRQRIRAVISDLMNEGLLIKQEGKGTYITPVVKNKYLNLICSPDIKSNDPFYNNLLVELTNFAAKESVNLTPLRINTVSNGFMHSPALIVGRMAGENLAVIRKAFQTIIAFEHYPEEEAISQIFYDHHKIGWNAAKTLSDYGHKRVIHLTGPTRYASASLRRDGFIEGARRYNIIQNIQSGKMNFQGGYLAGSYIKQLIENEGYTAVFVVNDWMAVGLIQYLKEKGLRIPEDVSVLGVDNIALSSQISPSLSTFALDMRRMVAEVFVLLNTLPEAQNLPGDLLGRKVVLTPVLIARSSIRQMSDSTPSEPKPLPMEEKS